MCDKKTKESASICHLSKQVATFFQYAVILLNPSSCPSYSLLGRPLPSLVLPLFNSIKPPLFIWLEFHLIQYITFGIYFLKRLKWARLTLKEHIWEWGDQWRGNMTSNCQIEALHLHLHLMPCVVCFSLFSFLPLFTLCGSSSPFFRFGGGGILLIPILSSTKKYGSALPAELSNLDRNVLHPSAVVPQQRSSLCVRYCGTEHTLCALRRWKRPLPVEVNENPRTYRDCANDSHRTNLCWAVAFAGYLKTALSFELRAVERISLVLFLTIHFILCDKHVIHNWCSLNSDWR